MPTTAEKLAELEQRIFEDAAKVEALEHDLENVSPDVPVMFKALDALLRVWADLLEHEATLTTKEVGHLRPEVKAQIEVNIKRVSDDRVKLLYAVSTKDDDAIESMLLALNEKWRKYVKSDKGALAGEQGVWPGLTIKPSKPQRKEWEDTADVAGDDDALGEYKPKGGGFFSSTFGMIATGVGVVLAVRWVLK